MNKRYFIKSLIFLIYLSYKKVAITKEKIKKIIDSKFRKTIIMIDPIFLKHHISPDHPETPERIKYIELALKNAGIFNNTIRINHNRNIENWIKEVHTIKHIESIKKNDPIAHEVAQAGVKACLNALDNIMSKNSKNAFCATRPPGHHALNTGKEEGFCYYNNIAITAKYAQKKYKLKKILIVDWDYHHGNATESMFYDNSSILFFSTHDQFAYPGTGDPRKTGKGNGKGFNINIHLPCGTGDQTILKKFKEILLPELIRFKPDLILISAGFDSRKDDPLGCFNISDEGFSKLTRLMMIEAEKYSNNRLISILEGGYNLKGNASAVLSHVKTLNE